MAAFKNVSLVSALVVVVMIIGNASSANAIRSFNYFGVKAATGYNLTVRLEESGGITECWNALMELKSCSNEIILFFLNGEAELGTECCRAIDIITTKCWPAMLTSLGFTAEEGNILRGYCDNSNSTSAAPAGAPPPLIIDPPQVLA